MSALVNKKSFYIVDLITGELEDTTFGQGYYSRRTANYCTSSVSLENPVVRSGKFLIDNKICKEVK